MHSLKNYFIIFTLTWLLLVASKIIFALHFDTLFASFPWSDRLYAILWGYRFDFAMSAIVALAATLFDLRRNALRMAAALLLASTVLLQLSDILYFEDAGRHVGYEITDLFNDAFSLFMTALSQHTLFTLLSLVSFPLMVLLFYRLPGRWLSPVAFDRRYFAGKVLLIALSVLFIRGMLAAIPLTPWQSSQIGNEKLASLALNGSYSALFSLFHAKGNIALHTVGRQDEAAVRRAFAAIYDDIPGAFPLPQKRNVVFFFLESWNGTSMKPYGATAEATPFYDSILERSLRPKAAIAGGHRTTEGIFATLVSYQNPLGRTVAKNRLQNFRYDSVIDLFNARGYRSAFFQGTAKETSGTGALAQALGFAESFGKEAIKERQYGTNYWGIHDPDLYRFALKRLSKMGEPFVIGINGATTHDDKLPEGIEPIRFTDDEKRNGKLNTLHFADAALGDFVTAVQQRYPNTLFVFFADHCAGVNGSTFEHYMIPLAFYGAGVEPRYVDAYVSQRDIAPTVVDLVFGDYRTLMPDFSGKSLLCDTHFVADYYHNGVLGWVEGQSAVEYTPEAGTTRCFDVARFAPQPVECTPALLAYGERATAFTDVSQRLLFEGKTGQFHTYRYPGMMNNE